MGCVHTKEWLGINRAGQPMHVLRIPVVQAYDAVERIISRQNVVYSKAMGQNAVAEVDIVRETKPRVGEECPRIARKTDIAKPTFEDGLQRQNGWTNQQVVAEGIAEEKRWRTSAFH